MNTKLFFAVAGATLLLFSCQKEIEPTNNPSTGNGFSFTAGIEKLATRADINSSNELVWDQGDQIGIFVNDASWDDKNQPFTLEGSGGSTTGKFVWNYGDFSNENANAAFFPWQGSGSTSNNIYDGTLYIKLPDAYSSYTSGQMLTPLVAAVTRGDSDYNPIEFKHAGAAVKVTISNLPAGVHSLGMTVTGQQVYGDFHVVVPASGSTPDAMALDGTADNTKNSVWLNIEPADSEREFTFLFPTPALTTPKLSFKMYDKNDIEVWSKNLKAQSNNVGRGEVLVMPAIDITPYEQFLDGSGDPNVSDEWTVIGTVNGTNWNADIPMITNGTVCIAKGVSFQAGGEFKVRKDGGWDTAYPSSNHVVSDAGTYDIIFDTSDNSVNAVATGCPYPEVPVTVGIDGNMSEWASVPGLVQTATSSNTIEQVKAYSDNDYIYVYVKRTKNDKLWSNNNDGNQCYYYYGFDLDNNAETGDYEKTHGKWESWAYLYVFGATEGDFNTTPTGGANGMRTTNVLCNGVVTDDAVEVEVAFPRDNFPTFTPGTIGVTVWGSKDAGPASTTFTVPSIPLPIGATSVTIDGSFTDWASADAISNSGSIREWKYGYDTSNLYFYFKIIRSDIIAAKDESGGVYPFDWRRYIYIAIDTDNDSTKGTNVTKGDMNLPGSEVLALVYPFRGSSTTASGTDGVTVLNGEDTQGYIQYPVGTETGKIKVYGCVDDNYGYLEISLPRSAIGNPSAGVFNVQFSLSSNITAVSSIEIK